MVQREGILSGLEWDHAWSKEKGHNNWISLKTLIRAHSGEEKLKRAEEQDKSNKI